MTVSVPLKISGKYTVEREVPATWVDVYGAECDGRRTQQHDAGRRPRTAVKVVLDDGVALMTVGGLLEPVETASDPVTRHAPSTTLHRHQRLLHSVRHERHNLTRLLNNHSSLNCRLNFLACHNINFWLFSGQCTQVFLFESYY